MGIHHWYIQLQWESTSYNNNGQSRQKKVILNRLYISNIISTDDVYCWLILGENITFAVLFLPVLLWVQP